jgi:hypothetical protein
MVRVASGQCWRSGQYWRAGQVNRSRRRGHDRIIRVAQSRNPWCRFGKPHGFKIWLSVIRALVIRRPWSETERGAGGVVLHLESSENKRAAERSRRVDGGWCRAGAQHAGGRGDADGRWLAGHEAPTQMRTRLQPGGRKREPNSDDRCRSMTEATVVEAPPRWLRVECLLPSVAAAAAGAGRSTPGWRGPARINQLAAAAAAAVRRMANAGEWAGAAGCWRS